MEIQELVMAGFTRNQARVYLELIHRPGQTAGNVAKKLSIDRSFTYGIMNSLVDKGVVTHITKEGKKFFHPSDPEHLLKELDDKRAQVSKVVDNLKALQQQKPDELSVEIYEGRSGLRKFIHEILESNQFYSLGGGESFQPTIDKLKYEYPHYVKEFAKRKIKGKTIGSPKTIPAVAKYLKDQHVEMRTLSDLTNPVSFVIFKDKLAIYSSVNKPFVIMIEGRGVANSLRSYFNHLWSMASVHKF